MWTMTFQNFALKGIFGLKLCFFHRNWSKREKIAFDISWLLQNGLLATQTWEKGRMPVTLHFFILNLFFCIITQLGKLSKEMNKPPKVKFLKTVTLHFLFLFPWSIDSNCPIYRFQLSTEKVKNGLFEDGKGVKSRKWHFAAPPPPPTKMAKNDIFLNSQDG